MARMLEDIPPQQGSSNEHGCPAEMRRSRVGDGGDEGLRVSDEYETDVTSLKHTWAQKKES